MPRQYTNRDVEKIYDDVMQELQPEQDAVPGDGPNELTCPYCPMPCMTKVSLKCHIDVWHLYTKENEHLLDSPYLETTNAPRLATCTICSRPLFTRNQFFHHYTVFHDIHKYSTNIITFENDSAFKKWKAEVERSSVTTFSSKVQDKNGWIGIYRCSREKTTGKNMEERTPLCTAVLKVKIGNNNCLEVEYCLEHFGHNPDPKYLKLNYLDKAEILVEIDKGFSDSEIVKHFKELYKENKCRLSYVNVSDVRQVRTKMDIIRQEIEWEHLESNKKGINEEENGSLKKDDPDIEEIKNIPSTSNTNEEMKQDSNQTEEPEMGKIVPEVEIVPNVLDLTNESEKDETPIVVLYDYKEELRGQCAAIASSLTEMINRLQDEVIRNKNNLNLESLKCIEMDLSMVLANNTIPLRRPDTASDVPEKKMRL